MAVNHAIKVFARLKKEQNSCKADTYVINAKPNDSNFEDLIFRNSGQKSHGHKTFRFHKVFGEDSKQDEVFDIVAKPLISRVLEGYNCTIFAYGQTGSGKTYTITGPPKSYADRGIIPRIIQYMFKQNKKISPKAVIHISYLEIYNEIGYDLLHPRQINSASSLEELPRITIMEDRKGEAHIQNLSAVPVVTEEEAMKLLFLGDTNRTIAETSMNEFSSRSHCIFTIHIAQGSGSAHCLRNSKLHIIDLAGSERVSKSLTTGTALTEAKHINLSLHYLQQVIIALSERRRSHIPYRNSMITYMLKDSLNGNCLSTMIANLAVSKNNIEESLSTCEYAHRVSLLKTEAVINEVSDPLQEIAYLKDRITRLEDQLLQATVIQETASLRSVDKAICSSQVEEFLKGGDINVEKDMLKIKYCFNILREKAISKRKGDNGEKLEKDKIQSDVTKLHQILTEKDEEIASLKRIIDNIPEQPVNPDSLIKRKYDNIFDHRPDRYVTDNIVDLSSIHNLAHSNSDKKFHLGEVHQNIKDLDTNSLRQFISSPEDSADIDYFKHALESKLQIATVCSDAIDQCQSNILYIRAKLEDCCSTEKAYLIRELEDQQSIYKKTLRNLSEIKNETNYLRANLEKTETRVMQKYCMRPKQFFRESDCPRNSYYSDKLGDTGRYYSSKFHTSAPGFTCHENMTKSYLLAPEPCVYCTKPNGLSIECTNSAERCFNSGRSYMMQHANNCCVEKASTCFKPNIENSFGGSYPTELHSTRNPPSRCTDDADCNKYVTCKINCSETNYEHREMYKTNTNKHIHVQPTTCEDSPFKPDYVDATKSCEKDFTCTCIEAEHSSLTALDDKVVVTPEKECQPDATTKSTKHDKYFEEGDSQAFREFMKTVVLTDEPEVDQCVFSFYRSKCL